MPAQEQPGLVWLRLLRLPGRVALFVLRWVVATPPKKPRSFLRTWTARAIPVICAAWLFICGPCNLLLPTHPGFSSVSDKKVTVYHQDHPPDLVNKVLAYARAGHERCHEFWGEPPGGVGHISIYLCGSRGRYRQLSFGGSGNAGSAGSSVMLYPAGVGQQNLAAIIRHEMSHAYLRQHIGYWQSFRVPVWLDEGIATYLGEPTWASAEALRKRLEAMQTPSIVSVVSVSSRFDWADVALGGPGAVPRQYACARGFVDYLVTQHGEGKLKHFVHQSLLNDVDDAFASVYAAKLTEMEHAWLTHEIASGHVPARTQLVTRRHSVVTAVRFYLPYALILFAILWVIRQCFVVGRLVTRLIRA